MLWHGMIEMIGLIEVIDDDKRDEYDCYWMRICVIECTEMIDNGMNCDE